MPIKHVIVDSSPLITLYKSQLAELLPQLFGQVKVPPAVWQEVTAAKDDIAARSLPQSKWIIQTEAIAIHPLIAAWDLGAGESQVLSYALAHPSHTVMIDDAAARRCAIGLNISTLGTGGMLVLAKRRGLIPSIAEPIQALQDAGLWLSDNLVQLLKQQAGI
ncbi:MAG: putative nucleic acid-binding protein, contains PIN domain [Phormidesmis priestleyi Ana]|uniref:Putative nucleic acid-binding protein, contains PIN domain n=1 Tax=Phormidesmis priestleyi Ana TaxID=1666911 RepID=A0A0P7ZYL5_9CYAN|nr:MAG: putative nucleic acid-binding protein, contains PIN domain [Phormidesmis priestleyi Ana]